MQSGVALERARQAGALVERAVGQRLSIHVLASDDVAAYAWPPAEIYLTQRLLDLLDDEELAAAIAHEAGHLAGDGHLTVQSPPDALLGRRHIEARADDWGLRLLERAGVPQRAMSSMLVTVSQATGRGTPTGRSLARRAAQLGERNPSKPE
jgi:Zn-dependent protease with chaperone function